MATTHDLLNELIELNNDRIAGFEKVLADINDENVDLKAVFQEYAGQSRKFTQELTALVAASAGEPDTGNTIAGTLHRAWIDIKALFGGTDRESILNEAERGEDTIKKAYHSVLSEGNLVGNTLATVQAQATEIDKAHQAIKVLRDASNV